MINSKKCGVSACCWALRFELLGLVLLVIATILTIVTFNSIGIAAMFIVGAVLCCHKCLGCRVCHSSSFDEELELISGEKETKTPVKKTTIKK